MVRHDAGLEQSMADKGAGREWTVGELRGRDWESLHQLWWICVKERNRLATEKLERKRLETGYGDYENENRDETVQKTMKAILDTLAERQQGYTEAFKLAKNDPSIDLSRTDGPQFTEPTYVSTVDDGEDAANTTARTRLSRKRKSHRRKRHGAKSHGVKPKWLTNTTIPDWSNNEHD
jgi:hypothetical protein